MVFGLIKEDARMKNVRSRKAKSTIGVMSWRGEEMRLRFPLPALGAMISAIAVLIKGFMTDERAVFF
jgi:hypothetical protein